MTGSIREDAISVVVPAYNEESVIARCLGSILRGAPAGAIELVVACNGCTDRTAEVAAGVAPDAVIVSTPEASKPAALNLGDAHATAFPRFFVDADVTLEWADLQSVAKVLRNGNVLAAAPRAQVDMARSSLLVRAYMRAWLRTPYVRDAMIGSGVYAVSSEGRHRWDEFPDIIGDDVFVRSLFVPGERISVQDATFTIFAPLVLCDLVRRKSRVYEGKRESAALSARNAPIGKRPSTGLTFGVVREAPLDAIVYAAVSVLSRIFQFVKRVRGRQRVWERDTSSR